MLTSHVASGKSFDLSLDFFISNVGMRVTRFVGLTSTQDGDSPIRSPKYLLAHVTIALFSRNLHRFPPLHPHLGTPSLFLMKITPATPWLPTLLFSVPSSSSPSLTSFDHLLTTFDSPSMAGFSLPTGDYPKSQVSIQGCLWPGLSWLLLDHGKGAESSLCPGSSSVNWEHYQTHS